MRKLTPAYVVASIVVALAGTAASAQTVARPGATTVTRGTTTGTGMGNQAVLNAPPATASSTSSSANNASGSSTTTSPSSTSSDAGNGSRSGSNTDSSAANTAIGSTSANGTALNPAARSGANGTRSGSNTNSSAANSAIGSTSATGTGSSSVNSSNTSSENTSGNANGIAGANVNGVDRLVNPALIGGVYGGVTADGEPMGNATQGNDQGNAGNQAQAQYNGTIGSSVTLDNDTIRKSQSFDRAIATVKQDRRKIGRNGQLLQSIAPRTNADRSNEMPDDPPSPSLTGSSSALTRR